MRMSTKGRYGLRVMLELAAHHGRGQVPVDVLAKRQDISAKYIHLLVVGLRSAGLVRTVRGPRGGCELARPPSAITALDVVRALEGSTAPVECVSDAAVCPRSGGCAAREVWADVASAIEGVLSGITLEQLATRTTVMAGDSQRVARPHACGGGAADPGGPEGEEAGSGI